MLVEELARRAAIVPLVEALACGVALERCAPGAAADALVAGMLAGAHRAGAGAARGRRRVARLRARARRPGALRGEKRFVDYGQFASHHLVAARDRGAGACCAWSTRAGAEVAARPLRTIGRTPQALRALRRRARPSASPGPDAVDALLQIGRALAAVQCVGAAAQALEQTVAYATLREAFGRPIGTFQAVKHHAANMAIQVAASRQLAFEALDALERGRASAAQVALAKASASRTVPEVTMLAHQIHGGNGIIEENDLYFFTLRGKDRSLAWGSVDECLADIASGIDAPIEWLG